MTPIEHLQAQRLCHPESWRRLAPVWLALHRPDATPADLLRLLQSVAPALTPSAQRVLRALQRQPWRVQALPGGGAGSARLGFQLQVGGGSWWLRFEAVPQLRIVAIESIEPAKG
jgi:hypothetical protein